MITRKSRVQILVAATLAAFTLATDSFALARAVPKPDRVTVVAMTDFHGALGTEFIKTKTGETVGAGGAAILSTYLKILKEKTNGPVIIVDGGDLFQGSMESNLAEGAPVIKLFNQMGVSASALGNHEFDFGPVGPKTVPREAGDDPRGALKERIREANFPVLAVNVLDENGRIPDWLKASTIVEKDNVRVGIIGAASVGTPSTTIRANLTGLRFIDPFKPIVAEATRLREQEKVDVVVLAYHAGGGCRDNGNQDDLSSCDPGEGFDLVKKLPVGLVDVVVAGHTHQGIAKRINNTVLIESFSHGKQIGWAEVPLSDKSEKNKVAGFIPVCASTIELNRGKICRRDLVPKYPGPVYPSEFMGVQITPDREIEALLEPDFERVRVLKERPLNAVATESFTRSYGGESALGNLTVDLMRQAFPHADVAVTNGGGLRNDLPAGPLNYGSVYEVFPFDNRAAVLKISGATLAKMVAVGISGKHGNLSYSGVTFVAEGKSSCEPKEILVNGQPLDVARIYTVIASDYLAGGGSGFDQLKLNPEEVEILWDEPYILREIIAKNVAAWPTELKPKSFFDPASPRQKVSGPGCIRPN